MKIYVIYEHDYESTNTIEAFLNKEKAEKIVEIQNEYYGTHFPKIPSVWDHQGTDKFHSLRRIWEANHPLGKKYVNTGYVSVEEVEVNESD